MGISYMNSSLSFCYFYAFVIVIYFGSGSSAIATAGNETDFHALIGFKAKITNDPFGVLNSWNDSSHFCQWHGVTCNHRRSRVTMLDRQSLKLIGSISPSIGNLSFLKELNLMNNSLSHEIPREIGYLHRLKHLILTYNSNGGKIPTSISSCTNLISILFSGNKLEGEIPAEIGDLLKLQLISISFTNLTGSIPHSIGNLSYLDTLSLDVNNLVGTIPDALGKLRGLAFLSLDSNRLSVTPYPTSSNSLIIAIYVDLSDNHLTGTLPIEVGILKSLGKFDVSGLVPSEGIFKNLSTTSLEENYTLCGGIPELHLPPCLSTRSKQSRMTHTLRLVIAIVSSLLGVASGKFWIRLQGTLDVGRNLIAVKVLNLVRRGAFKSFLAECEALRNIRHRIFLEEWLHPPVGINEANVAPRNLNVLQRLNIVVDVACALVYVHHHCETPIVHYDLKPSNILLDKEMTGHVGDFGLAKFYLESSHTDPFNQSSCIGIIGTLGPTDDRFIEGLNLHNYVKAAIPEQVVAIFDPVLLQAGAEETVINNRSRTSINRTMECLISIFGIGVACSVESPGERMSISNAAAQLISFRNKLHFNSANFRL
ncbi:serine-threonine protein kinase, plant-type, putative [Ricinus communis]|uniref:Serine-threonine protein kinase, plant-type, putative n=1 Tax=Ricinus communis TaxID=3988 RepID=B9T6W5_RICCO|nr:serine-threonine protein kinase, plant-type, putative [Ricinus communis]